MLLIRSIRHELFPLLSIRHAGSRFARRDSVRIELRRNVRIESNRKVPQTNRLSLGVLDMDVALTDHFLPSALGAMVVVVGARELTWE